MVKVWARIGITVEMTTEQYNALRRKAEYKAEDGRTSFAELTLSYDDAKFFMEHGTVDGDSYIPQEIFEDIERSFL